MRIAYFCTTGSMSLKPVQALAAGHEIVLMIRPTPGQSHLRRRLAELARRSGARQGDLIDGWTREQGIRSIRMTRKTDPYVVRCLDEARPDLICISSFRFILGSSILSIPRLGAVNLHCSLLPRHRGPIPLFWIYHADDRETGVTVHRATAAVDGGPILEQESFPLARGLPVEELNEENARRGAGILERCVASIEAGSATERAQDESMATRAPALEPGARMIDFESWPAERVWHFLAGLLPRYREPLSDENGAAVEYQGVGPYQAGARGRPGSVTTEGGGWILHCRDGVVPLLASGAGGAEA